MTKLVINALGDLHKVFRWADELVFVSVVIDILKKPAKSLFDKKTLRCKIYRFRNDQGYRLNIPNRSENYFSI